MSGVEPIKLEMDIEEYPAGYLVPIRNSEAIAICLKILAQNKNLLASKREAALSLRSSNLSWSDYGKRSIKFYEFLHNQNLI